MVYGSEVIALAAKKLAIKARLPPADPMVATITISAAVTGWTSIPPLRTPEATRDAPSIIFVMTCAKMVAK